MKETHFIIGGCRSGKSVFAQRLAEKISKERVFIATCVPLDEEMKDRVQKHRDSRDETWKTVEAPILLPESVSQNSDPGNVVLVDCLTLWVSNLLMYPDIAQNICGRTEHIIDAMNQARGPILLVSNEVGEGIVPDNTLARQFRDIVGFLNQKVAAAADRVTWMVAGIPVSIKPDRMNRGYAE